ncbi:hypothetical protein [Halalkalibacter urbisdiaboli]|uniref:hypothetical protein n=1 Tax=Halalkalibacter urbisdiaboli TaxID=1960589 RepID=UPI000B444CBB|nr:hypothetical protein [Halalkalibacter urbisdiaboli]
MVNKSERYIPLIVTVGQVAVFPYYIIWLKEVSLTYTLFAWLFAVFSFAAAWGYCVFQSEKIRKPSIAFCYIAMGIVYLVVGNINISVDFLPYIAILLQVCLGFLQGYFRAWHIKQRAYRLHAVQHYLLVGLTMIVLSFIMIISPVVVILTFGVVLFVCGGSKLLHRG